MIVYRKTPQLRVRRAAVPEPPFWAATTIAPYGARRASPVAIDYTTLTASAVERAEVTVVASIVDALERLERKHPLHEPLLIDGAEMSESVFGRASEAAAYFARDGRAATVLASTRSNLAPSLPADTAVTVAAWPHDPAALERLVSELSSRGATWGVFVPIVFPVTTDLSAIAQIADLARAHHAAFLASAPVDLDATARLALARQLELGSEDDEYAMLFHAPLDPINIATERHIAAVAASMNLSDFVLPPRWIEKSNWNASVLLTLTASRMLAMEHELDLAGDIARSARLLATLDKPIARIAASAHLGIIEGLDDVSAEIVGEWLEDEPPSFVERVNRKWRLRRDYGVAED